MALGLAGCGPGGLDRQQAAEETRTCASLIERVVTRAHDRSFLSDPNPKAGPLSPETLDRDPDAFYEALAARLAEVTFGPEDQPVAVSPASRLVARCRAILG
jgi:hypothetical protein